MWLGQNFLDALECFGLAGSPGPNAVLGEEFPQWLREFGNAGRELP